MATKIPTKKLSPGKCDMSCGGHIPSGEKPYTGLLRELEEELGVTNAEPVLVKKYTAGNEKQTEMIHLYYAVIDHKENDFTLQKEEVEQVKWFDYDKALELYFNKEVEATDWLVTQVPVILQSVFSKTQQKAYWKLPGEIKKVGFDFRWDTKKVWALDLPVEEIPIEELE